MKLAIAILMLAGSLAAADKGDYERSRQCSVAAKKYAGSNLQQSHYSQKYQRCFAVILYGGVRKNDLRDQTLEDIFEEKTLAQIETDNQGEICAISDIHHEQSCLDVRAYIDDHMKN
jgi:hypothetical protein